MNKLILCQGISGSGKTTWARNWAEECPESRIRLNYDDIRCMLGTYWVPGDRETIVKKIFDAGLLTAMEKGYDVVIDNMSNLNPKHVKEYENLAAHYGGYKVELKLFDTPVEECIRRDALRPIPIGEKVIKQQWRSYRNYIIQQSIKNIPHLDQKESLPHCILVDMDATLCFNVSGRPFYGPGAAEKMVTDEPIKEVCNLVKHYCNSSKAELIILTGRDESCRDATTQWLNSNGIYPSKILMRPNGSYKKGDIQKKEIFEKEIKDKYYVDFIIDDSSKVVQMWRELGLICLQPNEGKF